ncbi:hypothetical protein NL868_001321 [Shigella flexneri]|nr:hypothetical protein [Shigella flexneri]
MSVTIDFCGEELKVGHVPLKRFGALVGCLDKIPDIALDLLFQTRAVKSEEFLENIFPIASAIGEELPNFLHIASGVDLEKVEEADLGSSIGLLRAVLEVNNIPFIIEQTKNFQGVLQFQKKVKKVTQKNQKK